MSSNEIGMPHGRRTDNNAIEWKPMTDIQAARDTLARWGEGTSMGPWQQVTDWTGDAAEIRAASGETIGWVNQPKHATLIVAMTDPRLRDALDGMLELAGDGGVVPATFSFYARSIAAAILDIDKGLNA